MRRYRRQWRWFPLLAAALMAGFGCAASIDGEEQASGNTPGPQTPPTIRSQLRLVNFATWTGTSNSEHFTLTQMEISPYVSVGVSTNFEIMPGAILSTLLQGSAP